MKTRKCVKGQSCGKACISKNRICKKVLSPSASKKLDSMATPVVPIDSEKLSQEMLLALEPIAKRKKLVTQIENISRRLEIANYSGKRNATQEKSLRTFLNKVKKNPELEKDPSILRKLMDAMEYAESLADPLERTELKKQRNDFAKKYNTILNGKTSWIVEAQYKRSLYKDLKLPDEIEKRMMSQDKFKELVDSKLDSSLDLQRKSYELMGYNALPTVVPTEKDLISRTDVLRTKDGDNMVLKRGVTGKKFQEEFVSGDKHYVGKGMYGNGTYLAANYESGGDPALPKQIAFAYGDSVKAVAVKSDKPIFIGKSTDIDLIAEVMAAKYPIPATASLDPGVYMTLSGFSGYRAKERGNARYSGWQNKAEFFVMLDRGALLVTKDYVTR